MVEEGAALPVLEMAVLLAGLVIVPLDPADTPRRVGYVLQVGSCILSHPKGEATPSSCTAARLRALPTASPPCCFALPAHGGEAAL